MKKMFYILAVIGIVVISILAFTIPKNPFEMMPSILFFDKPLWSCIIFFGSFLYLILLSIIYTKLENRYEK